MTNKKRKVKPYLEESFTNKKGHVINPGDEVVIITTRSHSPYVNIGVYLGKRKTGSYNGNDTYQVVVEKHLKRTKAVHNNNPEIEWTWYTAKCPDDLKVLLKEIPPYPEYPRNDSYSAWNRVNKEHDEKMAEYRRLVNEREEINRANGFIMAKYKKDNYHEVTEKYTRISSLQNNMIYPLNMQLKDF